MRELTTIDLTTIALAYQQQNQPTHAFEYVTRTLALLAECQGIGPEYPHWDYYHCYTVLWWLGEEARALHALRSAYTILISRADAIQTLTTRTMFLSKVPMNRQICTAAQRQGLA